MMDWLLAIGTLVGFLGLIYISYRIHEGRYLRGLPGSLFMWFCLGSTCLVTGMGAAVMFAEWAKPLLKGWWVWVDGESSLGEFYALAVSMFWGVIWYNWKVQTRNPLLFAEALLLEREAMYKVLTEDTPTTYEVLRTQD